MALGIDIFEIGTHSFRDGISSSWGIFGSGRVAPRLVKVQK